MRNPFRDLPREVGVLVVVGFFVALGFGIVAPAIVLFARSFGVSLFLAGLVISAFGLMRFVSALGGGWLVNRIGERVVLGTGIGIVAVSSGLAGLAQDYVQLLVLRGIGGIGSAMFTVSSMALLLRVARPDQRARSSGAFQGGFLLGGIAGPAFGAPLTAWSLRAPFFVYALTLAIAGVVALVFLSNARLGDRASKPSSVDEVAVSLRQAIGDRSYRAAVINNFSNGWALFGIRSALLPIFVVEYLLTGRGWVSVGLFIGALVQGIALGPVGTWSDTGGRKKPLMTGGIITIVCALALALVPTLPTYLIAMAFFGIGAACIGTSSAAVVGDVIGGRGGTSVAVYQMASDAGSFIGPLACGFLVDQFSFGVAFVSTALISCIGLVMVATMPETRHRARTREPGLPAG